MKLHPALPQKMTVENLAQWITQNQIEKRIHTEEIKLTDKQVHEFEEKIANTTAAIYDLMDLEKSFKKIIKLGTPGIDGEYQPQGFTIPPTKGTKELEANRKYYSEILQKGFIEEPTDIYGIPYPEEDMIVFFDIEGNEYDGYNTAMNEEQKLQYGKLFEDKEDGASPLSA